MSADRPDRSAGHGRDPWIALAGTLLLHGLVLFAGNRAADGRPLDPSPGVGNEGPMSLVALSSDAAEVLLARLGPPDPLAPLGASGGGPPAPDTLALPGLHLPRSARGLGQGPPTGGSPPDLPPLLPPGEAGPRALPPALPALVEPLPTPGEPLDSALEGPSPEHQEAPPERPSPRAGPDPAGPHPAAGAQGEERRSAAAASGDQAPWLDAGLVDRLVRLRVTPEYPLLSRRRGEEGTVALGLEVRPDGPVGPVTVLESSGHPALDAAAVAAVRRWRFDPGALAEEGSPRRFRLPLRFALGR